MFLGTSAEFVRACGYELDAALHCALAADLAMNLVDGFHDNRGACALWFKLGLGTWFSRRIDERWTLYASGTTLTFGDDSWKWVPRVRALVSNGFAVPWSKMLDWKKWEEIEAQDHMVLWSRVDWMLSRKDAHLRAFLAGISDSLAGVPDEERPSIELARQVAALGNGLGGSPAELDEAWKQAVLKKPSRK